MLTELFRQLHAAESVRSVDGDAQRVGLFDFPAVFPQFGADFRQTAASFCQLFTVAVGEIAVAAVERLHDEIGRAGGAEELQSLFGLFCEVGRSVPADLQIGAAGQHRESLVGGVAADICTQVQRMQRVLQKVQVRAVGVVHSQ